MYCGFHSALFLQWVVLIVLHFKLKWLFGFVVVGFVVVLVVFVFVDVGGCVDEGVAGLGELFGAYVELCAARHIDCEALGVWFGECYNLRFVDVEGGSCGGGY